jgi:CxxC motif-containing protein
MTKKELICVICPNGCQLRADIDEGDTLTVGDITGHLCDKGIDYARQELTNPMRSISSNILVKKGDYKLVSVRTDRPIPLKKIPDVMKEIRSLSVNAPINIGDILIENVSGLSCNIIATREVGIIPHE